MVRLLTILCVIGTTISIRAQGPLDEAVELVWKTQFDLELHAWMTAPDHERPTPLLVTLPMMGETHESYAGLLQELQSRVDADTTGRSVMPYTLNFDLRGHGKSIMYKGETLRYTGMRKPHWEEVPIEIAATIKALASDSSYRIDGNNITVVGASIGANVAALLTELVPGIRRIVLLSPGENYRGLKPQEALDSFEGKTLILTRKRDRPSTKAGGHFRDLHPDRIEFRAYPERGHGTGIFEHDDRPMADLVNWILKE